MLANHYAKKPRMLMAQVFLDCASLCAGLPPEAQYIGQKLVWVEFGSVG